jgi:hypothetical protein
MGSNMPVHSTDDGESHNGEEMYEVMLSGFL